MSIKNLFRQSASNSATAGQPEGCSFLKISADDFHFESDAEGNLSLHLSCTGLILSMIGCSFLMLLLLAIAL